MPPTFVPQAHARAQSTVRLGSLVVRSMAAMESMVNGGGGGNPFDTTGTYFVHCLAESGSRGGSGSGGGGGCHYCRLPPPPTPPSRHSTQHLVRGPRRRCRHKCGWWCRQCCSCWASRWNWIRGSHRPHHATPHQHHRHATHHFTSPHLATPRDTSRHLATPRDTTPHTMTLSLPIKR